jgi:hypothetical protein
MKIAAHAVGLPGVRMRRDEIMVIHVICVMRAASAPSSIDPGRFRSQIGRRRSSPVR